MIKRSYMRPTPLLAVSVASLIAWTSTSAQEAAEPAADAAPAVDDATAFNAMGYAMASQLRLNIGFADEELEQIFQGMRNAANGEAEPDDFQDAVARAQQIYMARMQIFQQEEQERAAAIAEGNKAEAESFFASLEAKDGIQKTDSGLYYEVIQEGTGKSPGETDRVKVNYRGVLIDGREFDANENADFMVNRVVPGFSEGLRLMKEGGKIKLYIPSELGYGDRPARPGSVIEPGDALIFDVELLEVVAVPRPPQGPPPNLPPNLKPPPPPPSGPPPGPPPAPPPNMKPPASPPSGEG
jgi:FKBP-type peptidyl-prolyl cis-trans isomerase